MALRLGGDGQVELDGVLRIDGDGYFVGGIMTLGTSAKFRGRASMIMLLTVAAKSSRQTSDSHGDGQVSMAKF